MLHITSLFISLQFFFQYHFLQSGNAPYSNHSFFYLSYLPVDKFPLFGIRPNELHSGLFWNAGRTTISPGYNIHRPKPQLGLTQWLETTLLKPRDQQMHPETHRIILQYHAPNPQLLGHPKCSKDLKYLALYTYILNIGTLICQNRHLLPKFSNPNPLFDTIIYPKYLD